MKNVKLEVFNGSTKFTKEIEFTHNTSINKVIGTCINQLFEYNSRLRKYNANHFKANDLLSIVISSEDTSILDSYTINSKYNLPLKFGNTAKSKRKFASCLNDLMLWAAQGVKKITLDDLIKELSV